MQEYDSVHDEAVALGLLDWNGRTVRRNWIQWAAIGVAAVALLLAVGWASNGALSRFARDRAMSGLRKSFASDLQVKSLEVSVFPRLRITGEGIVLHYKGRHDLPPLISIRKLTGESGLASVLMGHVQQVRLEGLEIEIPPRSGALRGKKSTSSRIAGFVIDEVIADGAVLQTIPGKPGKAPLEFQIRKLTLHGAGPHSSMTFRATLENPEPPGEIESTGDFGPWQAEEPAETPVEGKYTFRNANLSVFPGICGTLSSEGSYRGVLEQIQVEGTTDTPDFALKVGGNKLDLKTRFQAVVDGTDGDTQLNAVHAELGHTPVEAKGSVAGGKGVQGKTVSLDVSVENGRLADLLRLAVKGPAAMSGAIGFRARLVVPPGPQDIAERVRLDGEFSADSAVFRKLNVQEKVNKLSHGGKGEPEESPADTVGSDFSGRFHVANGVAALENLSFRVPGVSITLNGTYGLMDERLDFHGAARMEAKLSQATTGIKSLLLKVVDPIFDKKGKGAVVPLRITGTAQKPSFGLDVGAKAK